ncbi:GNAT family N-acetyltransferase [Dongia sp.]|uniref:GNAT family N-acetyltransferase n=1 Tax=Dongia sp. TaxID=1977262 RepID=UPI0037534F14
MSEPIIETPRLILRRLAGYDAPALHEMLSDAETMRFWSTVPHVAMGETETWVAESVAATSRGDAHDFAVLRDGRVVGRVAFWMGNEIGFLFHREVWGQGIAREAVGALLHHGFGALRFASVRADVDPANIRSLTLLERLRFKRTGYAERTFKIGETWVDSVYLELKAEEFVAA